MLRVRRLYLWRSDLARAPWWAGGQPPGPPLPAGTQGRWLPREAWEQAPQLLDTAAARVRERYAAGARCFVIQRDADRALLYRLWVSAAPQYIDWIDSMVAPPEHGCLVFDVWTDAAWRGGTLHRHAATHAVAAARELNAPWISAGVEEHELLPFARMYARQGLGLIEAYDVITLWRIGPWRRHRHAPPRAALRNRVTELALHYRHLVA